MSDSKSKPTVRAKDIDTIRQGFFGWQHRAFVSRFKRVSDVRFAYSPSIDSSQSMIVEVKEPFLVRVEHGPVSGVVAATSNYPPARCLGMPDHIETERTIPCPGIKDMIVAPPNHAISHSAPMRVHFEAWLWPSETETQWPSIPKDAHRVSLCLAHASQIFKLHTSARPDESGWMPPACNLYLRWLQSGRQEAVAFDTYQRESGALIRKAAKEASFTAQPQPQLRRRSSWQADNRNNNNNNNMDYDVDSERWSNGNNGGGGDQGVLTRYTLMACEWIAGCFVAIAVPTYDCCVWTCAHCRHDHPRPVRTRRQRGVDDADEALLGTRDRSSKRRPYQPISTHSDDNDDDDDAKLAFDTIYAAEQKRGLQTHTP